jgi:hypothetical protein
MTKDNIRPNGKMSLEDRLDIYDLYAEYSWALDTGDADALEALFAPEPAFSDRTGNYKSIKEMTDYFFVKDPYFRGRQHIPTNILIRGDGDRATVRAFCTVLKWDAASTDPKTGQRYIHVMGWYEDVCVKHEGRWLFKERSFRRWHTQNMVWVGPLPDGVPRPVPSMDY